MSNIVKKLSVKTLIGPIQKPDEGKTVKLCRFIGIAKSLKTVSTAFGESTGLLGDFVGVNLETGEQSRSAVLYAPQILIDMIAPQIEQGNAVEFAFDICVTGDKSVAVGYRYSLDTVLAPSENDPMEKLLSAVNSLVLPAPKDNPPEPEGNRPAGKKGAPK